MFNIEKILLSAASPNKVFVHSFILQEKALSLYSLFDTIGRASPRESLLFCGLLFLLLSITINMGHCISMRKPDHWSWQRSFARFPSVE